MKNGIREYLLKNPAVGRISQKLYLRVPSQFRVSKHFLDWFAFFRTSESWTVEEHQKHQLDRINAVCEAFGARNAEFMHRYGSGGRIQWSSLEEFSRTVPDLSRESFREQMTTSYPPDIGSTRKYRPSSTSGTTGRALQFYHDRLDQYRENAAICHQWSRVGFDPVHSRRAEFRGLTKSRSGVDYQHDGVVRFNILDFSKEAIRRYAHVIMTEKLEFLHGYPSALSLLASTIKRDSLRFPDPRAILLASEMVYDWQLDLLQEAFPKSKLYAHYGCAERVVLAGWCETRRDYHVIPSYSYVEVDGKTKEIRGTNLYNSVNPFLRYRMTDVAFNVETDRCPDCGRDYVPRIGKIGGRTEDYLFSLDYGWIPPAIVTYPLKAIRCICEMQIAQDSRNSVEIRYRVHAGIQDQDLDREIYGIKSRFIEIMGESMKFVFVRVDGFERGATGKFKWIVSSLESPGGSMDG